MGRKVQAERPEGKIDRPKVEYHGFALDGVECAVLTDGRRGYIMRSIRQAIGLKRNIPVPAFEGFLARFAPKALGTNGNRVPAFEVTMPHGGIGVWTEAGILTRIASGVIRSALDGNLPKSRQAMVAPCMAIMDALGTTGEVALIDEATGYQHRRAPDALQDLYTRLIQKTAPDWRQRFHPDYYQALCKLFGFEYGNRHRALPPVIGKITMDWVYQVIFPPEIIAEIKRRQLSEKLHQWLTDGGLELLNKQRDAVIMIARSSVDYRDFEARCSVAFYRPGHQTSMIYPQ